jgi:Flp pilus assembly protein TadG
MLMTSVRPRAAGCAPPKGQGQRRGVAAVEFAVIASLLFTLILGIVEIGRAMMVLELLNNAARNGCRTGALGGSSNSTVTAAVDSVLSTVGVTGYSTTVQVNGTTADASTAVPGDALTVSVSVPYSSVTWLPTTLFLSGQSLSGSAVMRHE